ncbi:MAG: NUDIX hydrolase [Candidatus Moraniibacteriota bacterium]
MNNKTSHDSETPAKSQQVITACAFIFHDFDGVKKVFLPRRAKTKKFLPDVFELPGGHIEYGEDIVDGLKREIKEEFEMEIEVGESFAVFTYINEIKGTHSIEVIYLAQFRGDIENVRINPADHSEFIWISKDEIGKILSQNKTKDDPEIQAIRKGFEKISR